VPDRVPLARLQTTRAAILGKTDSTLPRLAKMLQTLPLTLSQPLARNLQHLTLLIRSTLLRAESFLSSSQSGNDGDAGVLTLQRSRARLQGADSARRLFPGDRRPQALQPTIDRVVGVVEPLA